MYAIIQTGGKQEKVSVGDVLTVEHIDNKKDVTFSHILVVCDADKIEVGRPYVKGAKVNAEVVEQIRGEKSVSFKYRKRKSSRRIHGHRQNLTRIKITDIALG